MTTKSCLKVLFACSELTPLIKTGGLADVCGSLPHAMSKSGDDVRIVLPGYHSILQKIPDPTFISLLELPLGTVTLCRTELNDAQILLVNHETFSNRAGNPYMSDSDRPWPDNAFRFALFSQAVCHIAQNLAQLEWQPDIVHCHDWQTGLVPALLSLTDTRPATLFTIHNLAYQGNIMFDAYKQLELPEALYVKDGLEFWGQASFLKGGLAYADRINTVSPNYAAEITGTAFGCGMEGLLQYRSHKLSGILNGIDTELWNPETDRHLAKNYSADTLEHKIENKRALQRKLQLPIDDDTIIFGVISRLAVQKGIDLIVEAFEQLNDNPEKLNKEQLNPEQLSKEQFAKYQLVILGAGESELQNQLLTLAKSHPNRISVTIGFDEPLSHMIEAGSDVFLMPSRYEPCGLNQMYSHRYGTLPLVNCVGGLADTVIDAKDKKNGNGFTIDTANTEQLIHGLTRIIEVFKDKDTWQRLQRRAMQTNYSWNESAAQYRSLYLQTLDENPNQVYELNSDGNLE